MCHPTDMIELNVFSLLILWEKNKKESQCFYFDFIVLNWQSKITLE